MTTFAGFPKALEFLEALARNNNREWFEAHKVDYKQAVQEPALAFIEALGERLKSLSRGIIYDLRTNGPGSLMRVNRDVRFSKDKRPYKTNLGIAFWEGTHKKLENPAFYFHMEPIEIRMYSGFYRFSEAFLESYRRALENDKLGKELEAADAQIKGLAGYVLGGEQSKRVPSGYSADHPRADWLRYKGLHVGAPLLDRAAVSSGKLVDICFEQCHDMLPFHQWLVKAAAQ